MQVVAAPGPTTHPPHLTATLTLPPAILPQANASCLADLHATLHARHLSGYLAGTPGWASDPAPCRPAAAAGLQAACLALADRCFGASAGTDGVGSNITSAAGSAWRRQQHDLLARHLCPAHTCDKRRKRVHLQAAAKVGAIGASGGACARLTHAHYISWLALTTTACTAFVPTCRRLTAATTPAASAWPSPRQWASHLPPSGCCCGWRTPRAAPAAAPTAAWRRCAGAWRRRPRLGRWGACPSLCGGWRVQAARRMSCEGTRPVSGRKRGRAPAGDAAERRMLHWLVRQTRAGRSCRVGCRACWWAVPLAHRLPGRCARGRRHRRQLWAAGAQRGRPRGAARPRQSTILQTNCMFSATSVLSRAW